MLFPGHREAQSVFPLIHSCLVKLKESSSKFNPMLEHYKLLSLPMSAVLPIKASVVYMNLVDKFPDSVIQNLLTFLWLLQ